MKERALVCACAKFEMLPRPNPPPPPLTPGLSSILLILIAFCCTGRSAGADGKGERASRGCVPAGAAHGGHGGHPGRSQGGAAGAICPDRDRGCPRRGWRNALPGAPPFPRSCTCSCSTDWQQARRTPLPSPPPGGTPLGPWSSWQLKELNSRSRLPRRRLRLPEKWVVKCFPSCRPTNSCSLCHGTALVGEGSLWMWIIQDHTEMEDLHIHAAAKGLQAMWYLAVYESTLKSSNSCIT